MQNMAQTLALAMLVLIATDTMANEVWTGNRWELGLRAGGAITDDSFNLDGKIEVLTMLRMLGPDRAIEFELSADQLDFGIDYGLKHQSFSINYLEINRAPLWDPYFLVGAGLIRFASPGEIQSGADAMVQVAIGGSWELLENKKLLLRGDIRVRYDMNDSGQPGQDGFGDAILSFGLSLPFGTDR